MKPTIRALLLAAGMGTRLKPLTDYWPKCLMPIGGRPLLEYWLQTLRGAGINDVLVNTHYQSDKVLKFLAREQFEGWVQVVHEKHLLGTAGTLRANSAFFQDGVALLIHADNWCQCDFNAFVQYHLQLRPKYCAITMMTFDTDTPQSCGIVEVDGDGVVLGFHEKVANPPGKRANAAVYMLEPEVLKWLNENQAITDFSTQVLPNFIGRIATWQNSGVHRDIGTVEALRAAQGDPLPELLWSDGDQWSRDFKSSQTFASLASSL